MIPLTFREEQYNVHNLHAFWCNCLDALADYLERHGRRAEVAKLDEAIVKLDRPGPSADPAEPLDLVHLGVPASVAGRLPSAPDRRERWVIPSSKTRHDPCWPAFGD